MARLLQAYGKMHANVEYQVEEEGRDFYRFKNGYFVPKNLVDMTVREEVEEEYSFDYDPDFER